MGGRGVESRSWKTIDGSISIPSQQSTPSKWTRRVWVANCCWPPPGTPEKQTVGTATASHEMLTLQALQVLSMPAALQREAAWAEKRLLGDLRQSVPQNSRVHLHIIETMFACPLASLLRAVVLDPFQHLTARLSYPFSRSLPLGYTFFWKTMTWQLTTASWVSHLFSLRSCRSSSVNLFDFSQGNFAENLGGILQDFFRPRKYGGKKFGQNFGAFS